MKKQGVTYKLTYEDAIEIWHRRWTSEFQHRIASSYDVNPGRVSEVLKEHKDPGSKQEAQSSYGRSV